MSSGTGEESPGYSSRPIHPISISPSERRLYQLDLDSFEPDVWFESFKAALHEIAERSRRNPPGPDEPSLGLLSAATPKAQRKAFRLLQKESKNRETLETLRHSLLTLCLEPDQMPASEAPMLGRPGVRLPLNYFALHYWITDKRTTVTMMPSPDWNVPNAEFVSVLEKKLERVKEIVS